MSRDKPTAGSEGATADDAATEAAQNVVDEVTSWEYSADRDTIADRLDDGLRDAGVTMDDAERRRVLEHIDDLKRDEDAGTPRVDGDHVAGATGATGTSTTTDDA